MRGTFRLDLPVSYQNLLDGVIQFVVSDGHEGTQTVIPIAYTPNNDLFVSADQGGFEIVNVHPGNNVYSELELRGNWSGSGKSLLNIVIASGPRLVGISNLVTWPNINSVSHIQPTSDVKIFFENTETNAEILLTDKNGVETNFVSQNGIITIPVAELANVIERRVSLELTIGSNVYSTLFFLNDVETESFSNHGYIGQDGSITEINQYELTDLIDLYDVVEIVYSGFAGGNANAIAAYNDDGTFNKLVLEKGHFDNTHIVVDGTYRYIKACAAAAYDKSLKLYFRTRG